MCSRNQCEYNFYLQNESFLNPKFYTNILKIKILKNYINHHHQNIVILNNVQPVLPYITRTQIQIGSTCTICTCPSISNTNGPLNSISINPNVISTALH